MKGDDLDVHPAGDGIPECFNALFLLISFGYMLPWTSLGALIAYYKETYSAAFYVKLYCAYYLPGLPVALLQYRFDPYLDWRYGSQRTYLIRGVLSYLVMIAILLSLVWLTTRRALLVLFVSLGVFGWLCHGTASMMASMYPPSAIAYLQTGFRCPEIYTIAAVAILHLGKRATVPNLDVFYVCNAAMSVFGLVAWCVVVGSRGSKRYFDIKDGIGIGGGGGGGALGDALGGLGGSMEEVAPLLDDRQMPPWGGSGRGGKDKDSTQVTPVKQPPGGRAEGLGTDEERGGRGGGPTQAMAIGPDTPPLDARSRSLNGHKFDPDDGNSSTGSLATLAAFTSASASGDPTSTNRSRNLFLLKSAENAASFMSSGSSVSSRSRRRRPADDGYAMSEELYQDVRPLCAALIIVMFCSIFQASFFAYVSSPQGREIEQILYFTRLFADLLGRPLTRLPRPGFLRTKGQLLTASILRIALMVAFFVYILVPSCPQSDAFVVILVAAFSIMNGYFTVLIYEYAAAGRHKSDQTAATRLLNICFQVAAFVAVVLSVTVTSLGWLDHVIPTVDDVYYDDQAAPASR